jgi:hypothetical protein
MSMPIALQLFWLTATKLGLKLQPERASLIIVGYVCEGMHFSRAKDAWSAAKHLSVQFDNLIGGTVARQAGFMGRIGVSPVSESRSTRLPLNHLMVSGKCDIRKCYWIIYA